MSKLHSTVIIFGCALFFWDISYGIGWLAGWFFISLLRLNREKFLEKIIDFENFSMIAYMSFLVGVTVWIALPLLASVFAPQYINPWAIFGAYIIDRILMFVTKAIVRGE